MLRSEADETTVWPSFRTEFGRGGVRPSTVPVGANEGRQSHPRGETRQVDVPLATPLSYQAAMLRVCILTSAVTALAVAGAAAYAQQSTAATVYESVAPTSTSGRCGFRSPATLLSCRWPIRMTALPWSCRSDTWAPSTTPTMSTSTSFLRELVPGRESPN